MTTALPADLLEHMLLDAVDLGIVVLDGQRQILAWNRWMSRHADLARDLVIGRPIMRVFPQMAGTRLQGAVDTALSHRLAALLSPSMHPPVLPLFKTAKDRQAQIGMQQLINITPLKLPSVVPAHDASSSQSPSPACMIQIQDVTASVVRERKLREQTERVSAINLKLKESQAIADEAVEELTAMGKFNEAILLNSPLPMGVYTASGQCVEANAAYANAVGTTRANLLSQNFQSIPAFAENGLLEDCLMALALNQPQQREFYTVTSAGKEVWMAASIVPTQIERQRHLLIQFADLTASKLAEMESRNKQRQIRTLVDGLDTVISLRDQFGKFLLINTCYERTLGFLEKDVLGKTVNDIFPADIAKMIAEEDREVISSRRPITYENMFVPNAASPPRYFLNTKTPLIDENGEVYGICAIAADITERKRYEQELSQFAFNDSLTQLPNRRLLLDRLKQALLTSKRQNSYGALLFLDLNKFKQLNDSHGHEVGDLLLVEVAWRLRAAVRDTDTIARLGGDEFVVLLEGLGPELDAAQEFATAVSEKIFQVLSAEYVFGEIRHHGSASIGITHFVGDEADPDQVIKRADMDMYEAKRIRRDRD